MTKKRVVITGIGLMSSAGIGIDAHLAALAAPAQLYDTESQPPYTVYPVADVDWSEQISKRDQRQMELWQKLGVYGAGLALDSAGAKNDLEMCSAMDMIIAAAGGERDRDVDTKILSAADNTDDRGQLINDVLTTELRPTLFLAQLSNLLAGNISIVHKVTGSSRTFMGEESAGISALSVAEKRIRHGQSHQALVGGSFNGQDPEFLLAYELGGFLHDGPWKPVFERDGDDGIISGSASAFLVIESEDHAKARGAHIFAELSDVKESLSVRDSDYATKLLDHLKSGGLNEAELVISGASGCPMPTQAEKAALGDTVPMRAISDLIGHIKEPQFIFAVALAALAVSSGKAVAPFATGDKSSKPASNILATTIGFVSGEGSVLIKNYDRSAS